jgi:prepilin-type N-terminal cleavage/methylation domain-containing protein
MSTSPRRPGFTLLEILVVMSLMAFVIALSIGFIQGLLRTYEADTALFQRIVAQAVLAERFRADVAGAEAAPAEAGQYTAGRRCLILRLPGGRLVVYRLLDGQLQRHMAGGAEEVLFILPLGSDQAAVEFERGGNEGRLVTLRWVETRGLEEAPVRHALEFTAALGGDLR